MSRDELQPYLDLMGRFYSKTISAEAFEKEYLTLFKADNRRFPDEVFAVLNGLFTDVDTFVSDPSLRDENDLDAHQLLECSRKAYVALDGLLSKP